MKDSANILFSRILGKLYQESGVKIHIYIYIIHSYNLTVAIDKNSKFESRIVILKVVFNRVNLTISQHVETFLVRLMMT